MTPEEAAARLEQTYYRQLFRAYQRNDEAQSARMEKLYLDQIKSRACKTEKAGCCNGACATPKKG